LLQSSPHLQFAQPQSVQLPPVQSHDSQLHLSPQQQAADVPPAARAL
jgi:hypothetical protein